MEDNLTKYKLGDIIKSPANVPQREQRVPAHAISELVNTEPLSHSVSLHGTGE
jgi:hypothetical protein